ncbi:MAG: glycoside hydrolase family 28 protein [Imperialibacter sp.]|uniref:glycoside hydrolase family 28 protein n=1 Tax=Imperialibacter sp. TaxID=2038411 RepID=UPI003A8BB1AC
MKLKIASLFFFISHLVSGQGATPFPKLEFDMPKMAEPVIPTYRVSLLDFGGVPDGATLNTEAFAKAIDAIVSKGGGHLVVPRGIWLTGPITLKSNLDLHVEEGALILFSEDKTLYPIVATSFEGLDTYRCISPINAFEVENISITGKGVIDGNGDSWRLVKRSKVSSQQWKEIVASGGLVGDDGNTWYPSESFKKGVEATSNFNVPDNASMDELKEYKDFLRPVMISLRNSRNVMLDGPTFQNSPAWNIHPLMCENLIVRNLTVRNPWYSQNGDGIDIESCKNTWVYNNSFDVGDDAICIKSGKDADGRKRGTPTENLVVFNNIVYHGHGGFTVGSEMSGGVKNVHVSKCTFIGTDCGLRFKSTRGRGGVVENVYISDIDMYNIAAEPIRFNLFYGGQSPILEDDQVAPLIDDTPVPVTEETPSFKDIYMKNIRSVNSGVAGFFQGLPEMNLKNVNLDNVYLSGKKGVSIIDADGMSFKNVTVVAAEGNPFTIYNAHNLTFSGFKVVSHEGRPVSIQGKKTSNLTFLKADFSGPAKQMLIGEGVDPKTVKMK